MRNLLKTLAGGLAALALLVVASAAPALAHGYKVGDIEIVHPNARAMVPGAKVGGGFMTLVNQGKTDDRLVSVTSPVTDNVQLHEMSVDNGVMKMRQLKDGIALPAGATVKLEHGGLHVMFMDVKTPFKEGEMIDATLHFEKAGNVDVKFSVSPANGKAAETHHDMKDMKAMPGMDKAK
jgi:periplasmic copper chaperone A